ncbi:TonB-dependent receptor [Robertkochia solimangrovi]|nr:TonB-dependent receptor [Robertkochia solimangrovi]
MTNAYDAVTIRSGGGSVQYGSGAVGGSVHLENRIAFDEDDSHRYQVRYGSFNTLSYNLRSQLSGKNSYLDAGIDRITSDNDYEYPGTGIRNRNGAFEHLNLSLNTGYKLDDKNTLGFFGMFGDSDRNFSGTLTAPASDKYADKNIRSMLKWTNTGRSYESELRIAYLFERYEYYADHESDRYTFGRQHSAIADYNLDYHISSRIKTSLLLNYTSVSADGSNIGDNNRNTLAVGLMADHTLSEHWKYGINLRQEFLNEFDNPMVFSAYTIYRVLPEYSIKANISRNYRVPTFNDLFWDTGGNEDLEPEHSMQYELGNILNFHPFRFTVNLFYIKAKDMIKWQPDTSGQWVPVNVASATNYGLELRGKYKISIGEHQLHFNASYAYTKAIDNNTDKQLIYVPYHKITGLADYSFRRWNAYYQFLMNGEVYTTTDNSDTVDAYMVANLGINYRFFQRDHGLTLGLRIANIFDKYYENVAYRPMPGRNFQFQLTYNIN